MTTPAPYSPATATAITMGVTDAGYVESTGVSWDDGVATFNAQAIEQRNALIDLYMRDTLAALRRDLLPAPTTTLRVLCVGDSLTVGASSTDGTGYRGWLADLLARQHVAAAMSVCAFGGQTLRYVAPLALAQLPTVQPDIVLINLGTNDVAMPDTGDWQDRYGQFVDAILASSPNVKVVCARIATSRQASLSPGEQTLDTWVDAVVAARQATGRVAAADMTVVPERWTVDGIHPLDAGYLLMAQQWLAAITPWIPALAA